MAYKGRIAHRTLRVAVWHPDTHSVAFHDHLADHSQLIRQQAGISHPTAYHHTMSTEPWYKDGLTFTCTQCGNCCTGPTGYVWFNDVEARTMAAYLKISPAAFHRNYTRKIFGRQSLTETHTEHGYDCVFLKRDPHGKAMCSVYPVRPAQCRSWPFWTENLRSAKSYEAASERCPGMTRGQTGQGRLYPLESIRIIRDGQKATGE
jgi:Fe-S-cluster containining protein